MADKYSKNYDINYYDVDYRLQCKLSTIVNFLCDIGNSHSEHAGDTIEKLVHDNMIWVFYKYDIKINKYPKYRETVTVTTEAKAFNKFYAHRGYTITNEKGEVLVEALALFFLIDIKRRRPIRIPEEKMRVFGAEDVNKVKIEMDSIKDIISEDNKKSFNIRYSDIDSNGHVNNEKYMEWAVESVPEEIFKNFDVKRIKVDFEKETTYGHKVDIFSEIEKVNDNKYNSIHLIKDEEGKELTKLEIEWERE